ncbi:MAG: hypothetical protein NTZ27_00465 [Ignavibacteriales bacterium]|nr:hypothetical protein [Ignavibacteriales bacterium]
MKLILPKNVFSAILKTALPQEYQTEILYQESSLICKSLEYNTSAIALIPSLELVNHRNLFVSNKIALSFDGVLSNSYFYFIEGEKKFQKIYLRGDISLNEILLAKILFAEKFSSQIDITLDTNKTVEKGRDYIIAGDENFHSWDYSSAISLSDEVSEMIDLPYVNFVFASQDKNALEKFNEQINPVDEKIDSDIANIIKELNLSEKAKEFLTENLGSVYFDMTDNEETAVNELIKLIFYHGIIDDIFEVKFLPSK